MIRKAIMVLGALMLVASGVAAVSAYEAHIINVTAHVENALNVAASSGTAIGGSAAFPEEWLSIPITVDLSGSFKNQTPMRVRKVGYKVCAEEKATLVTYPAASWTHLWMGGAAYASIDASTTYIFIGPVGGSYSAPTAGFCTSVSNTLDYNILTPAVLADDNTLPADGDFVDSALDNDFTDDGLLNGSNAVADVAPVPATYVNESDTVKIWLDVPVFKGYYNEDTDVCDKPRPATTDYNPGGRTATAAELAAIAETLPVGDTKCQAPSMIVDIAALSPTGPALPTGTNFGMDVKIQVTSIGN